MNRQTRAIGCAILAAALYALNAPVSKLLLFRVPETMMAAFLYLGAGIGVSLMGMLRGRMGQRKKEAPLTRKDLPYTVGMVLLDIAAPVFLMMGLKTTEAASVSLLNNFEIVATSLIALLIFRERIRGRLWGAIGLVTLASVILSMEDVGSLTFSSGSLLVLLACVCWGFENNCTRMLSAKDPMQIVVVKGFGSGLGALLLALFLGESFPGAGYALMAMLLGYVAYGLSIYFYIYAQRTLGAAKTSAYYAVAPFIGVLLALLVFREMPSASFFVALPVMLAGAFLAARAD